MDVWLLERISQYQISGDPGQMRQYERESTVSAAGHIVSNLLLYDAMTAKVWECYHLM